MLQCVKKHFFTPLLLVALLVSGAFPTDAAAETVIKIGGFGGALGVMKLLAAGFEKSHRGVKVQVLPSLGSSGGIKAVLQGTLDIGVSGRELKDDEKGKGAVAAEIAKTPFVFITTKVAQNDSLTIPQLEKIYEGQTTTWSDGSRIRLVLRPEGDSDTQFLQNLSPKMKQAVKSALARQGMLIAMTDQENVTLMETIPGAFGVSTLTQIITENVHYKILSFNGTKPSAAALAAGSYPFGKPIYLVTVKSVKSAQTRQFIDYVHSPAGRKILANSGNVPVESGFGR